ncbi:tRNA1(Val) (adenine(37)-N6)-methyltransferase [Tatumella citrea]|uniref:tRNA1(Val) (adenine(37)-N6)-methyltransferase n=1 Tax=Tatumella citrea TaxID=53336 RepID=A0A1Y0LAK4_TATCI|nr:tRNA1(Val) (adenine(37)-N6)-methyltransferase [Tatumella citrea]ARU94957.1 hypothetical protein A7K98_15060 [Tatumella citrea]ARU98995.1 hypothetical protein A7K99_15045 [Tatumella citrea]
MSQSFKKNGFTFRQFFVAHDQCGMKVSTDGIILGATAPVPVDGRLLDIGSGSGLISLMMAQRIHEAGSVPQIDAVEIDLAAVSQSQQNIAQSPWPDAIQVHHADILTWEAPFSRRYTVIVSNPPFFSPGVNCSSSARQTARYTTTLSHQALLRSAQQHLAADGWFCVILPVVAGEEFISLAKKDGWTLRHCRRISEFAGRQPHRLFVAFSLNSGECVDDRLVIRESSGGYSDDYRQLTGSFYLSR